jgi:hypothetical protein
MITKDNLPDMTPEEETRGIACAYGPPVPQEMLKPGDAPKFAAKQPGPLWVCEGCGAWNTGKFCTDCGKPKPEEVQTFVLCNPVSVWVCKSCGNRNTGESCAVCGKPKPV